MQHVIRRLLNAIFLLCSKLPMPVLYVFSDLSFIVLFYGVQYRKKVVLDNLRSAFPDKEEREIQQIAKAFFRHFCDLIVETLKFMTISEAEIKRRLQVTNIDLLNHYFEQNRSAILYMGHYGNWEWLPALPLHIRHKMITFYKPLSNSYFEQILKRVRERFGMYTIESKNAYRALVNFADQQVYTLTIMIGDQSPTPVSSKAWLKFLNQDTAFLVGADRIAKKTGQVLLFPTFKKRRRGHYEVTLSVLEEHPASASNHQIIEQYASQLEAAIHADPSLWLWTHRRWKLEKEAASA